MGLTIGCVFNTARIEIDMDKSRAIRASIDLEQPIFRFVEAFETIELRGLTSKREIRSIMRRIFRLYLP